MKNKTVKHLFVVLVTLGSLIGHGVFGAEEVSAAIEVAERFNVSVEMKTDVASVRKHLTIENSYVDTFEDGTNVHFYFNSELAHVYITLDVKDSDGNIWQETLWPTAKESGAYEFYVAQEVGDAYIVYTVDLTLTEEVVTEPVVVEEEVTTPVVVVPEEEEEDELEEYVEPENPLEEEEEEEVYVEPETPVVEEETPVVEEEDETPNFKEDLVNTLSYQTHVEKYGWTPSVHNGMTSGTVGQAKRLEGITIDTSKIFAAGNIEYRTHVEKYGWMDWKQNGEMSGTEGEAKRLEAIQIRLTDELAELYDVVYRVHAEKYGWLGWAKNGEQAGTAGFAYRLESIEVKLSPKGTNLNNSNESFYELSQQPEVTYTTHVQSFGWQENAKNGATSGTVGLAKRLEGIKIDLKNSPVFSSGGIEYQTHVEKYGWMPYVSDGELSGTAGEAKRLEAIKIKLTGDVAKHFDVYYRVHVEKLGWLDWAKNGESSGTSGFAYRLEGIEVQLVRKNKLAPGKTTDTFINKY